MVYVNNRCKMTIMLPLSIIESMKSNIIFLTKYDQYKWQSFKIGTEFCLTMYSRYKIMTSYYIKVPNSFIKNI